MQNIEYWVWLSRIENVEPIILLNLIQKYKSPKIIWNKTEKELLKENIDKDTVNKIINKKYRYNLEKYIIYMKQNNIHIINIFDEEYPIKLKNTYDPPAVLYIKGNKNILNNDGIAIVGARNATTYGKKVAKEFAYNLSKYNINIVSGLARGIDSYAHLGAILANGRTIAVVGTGLDRVYPRENKMLQENIIKNGGAIISEYVIGTEPLSKNFPARNRIISGISDEILIIEAKEKSGALITGDFALEQGRELSVIPGNIDNLNSVGTNELIKQGAKIVTKIEDIIYK